MGHLPEDNRVRSRVNKTLRDKERKHLSLSLSVSFFPRVPTVYQQLSGTPRQENMGNQLQIVKTIPGGRGSMPLGDMMAPTVDSSEAQEP